MVFKVVDATELRTGSYIVIENESFVIKSMDVSKTGKHGHAKCRIEAVGVITGKKKVMVVPGHERFEVPMIEKRKAQVLSIVNDRANLMDSESFESFDLNVPEELQGQVTNGVTVEYWDMDGVKVIKRVVT
jgi:translation initiation factor 5A